MLSRAEIVRAFIATPMPEETRNQAVKIGESFLNSMKGLKLVKSENLHLTLAFIGDIHLQLLDTIDEPMSLLAQSLKKFEVRFDRIGTFPSVIFIKTSTGERELIDLSSAIRIVLRKGNIPYDSKPFKGHLTLARSKDHRNKAHEFLSQGAMDARFDIGFTSNSFSLIQSQLTPEGPIYTTLKNYKLQA